MIRIRRTLAILIVSVASLALLLLAFTGQSAQAQGENVLTPGVMVEGEITTRDGDEWMIQLCAGDLITITMQSADFGPYLEIYGPDEDDPLTEAEAADQVATIDDLVVEDSGPHIVIAAGERRRDRGAYTLAVTVTASITGADKSGSLNSDDELDTELDTEPVDGLIVAGEPVTGTLRARRTVAWGFRGCAGQIISAEAVSDEFVPYVELYANGGDDILAEGDDNRDRSGTIIEEFVLPKSGDYIVLVAGETRRDAGDYTLSLTVLDEDSGEDNPKATQSPTANKTPTPRSTPTPTRRNTPTPTKTPTPAPALCTVKVDGLNLRSGPGSNYQPPIGSLPLGAEVRMIARDAAANWIQVEVVDSGRTGWVSSASQFVTCNTSVQTVPVGTIPPTPTTAPQPTPTPTPTSTPVVLGFRPTDGDDGNDFLRSSLNENQGRVALFPGFAPSEIGDPLIFRDRMVLRIEVFDTRVGLTDGDGIREVTFRIEDADGHVVHRRTERTPGYCIFGGGEPDCTVLYFEQANYRWPDGEEIANGDYQAQIDIVPENGGDTQWRVNFTVDIPGRGGQVQPPAPGPAPNTARINSIGEDGGRYVVNFETFGFAPTLPGQHVHFFWNTVPPEQAGVPGGGPWQLYPAGNGASGASPFTLFGVQDRPGGATQICVLVANPNHSVNQGSGNCANLP